MGDELLTVISRRHVRRILSNAFEPAWRRFLHVTSRSTTNELAAKVVSRRRHRGLRERSTLRAGMAQSMGPGTAIRARLVGHGAAAALAGRDQKKGNLCTTNGPA